MQQVGEGTLGELDAKRALGERAVVVEAADAVDEVGVAVAVDVLVFGIGVGPVVEDAEDRLRQVLAHGAEPGAVAEIELEVLRAVAPLGGARVARGAVAVPVREDALHIGLVVEDRVERPGQREDARGEAGGRAQVDIEQLLARRLQPRGP
ncbi:hypothetical protein FQZ97_661360 [compost metagenome]